MLLNFKLWSRIELNEVFLQMDNKLVLNVGLKLLLIFRCQIQVYFSSFYRLNGFNRDGKQWFIPSGDRLASIGVKLESFGSDLHPS